MLPLLLVASALAAPPPLECQEGTAQLHKKATVCCWEGQEWDKKAKQCTGEPTCLEGFASIEVPANSGSWTCRPELMASAGVLSALQESGGIEGIFGTEGLEGDLVGGIGGLVGASGEPVALGGLGNRQPAADQGERTPLGNELFITGEPIILGALDKLFIDAGIIGADDELSACTADLAAEGWSQTGKVVIKFVVNQEGEVDKSSVKMSTLGHPETETCLAAAIAPLSFPPPKGGGIAIVSYPFWVGPEQ